MPSGPTNAKPKLLFLPRLPNEHSGIILYRINIRAHKRSERESWLDVADRKGYLDKIYAIVSAELIFNPDQEE